MCKINIKYLKLCFMILLRVILYDRIVYGIKGVVFKVFTVLNYLLTNQYLVNRPPRQNA